MPNETNKEFTHERPGRHFRSKERKLFQRWLAQYRNMQWQCPVCTEQLTLTMPWTKRTHLLQRHPLEVVKRREEEGLKPGQQLSWLRMSEETHKNRTPVLATDELPKAERGWTCWVCEKDYLSCTRRRGGPLVTREVSARQKERESTGSGESSECQQNAPGPKRKRSEEWARHLEKGGTNTTGARQPATTPMVMQEMSAACGAMRSKDRSSPMD